MTSISTLGFVRPKYTPLPVYAPFRSSVALRLAKAPNQILYTLNNLIFCPTIGVHFRVRKGVLNLANLCRFINNDYLLTNR